MIENAAFAIVLIFSLILVVYLWPKSSEDNYRVFLKECRRQGMTFDEQRAAVGIRVGFVRLRRLSSDLCMDRDGKITREEINRIAGDIAVGLAAGHNQEAAKSFLAWVANCPDSEILYDDARQKQFLHNVETLRAKGLWPPDKKAKMDREFRDAFKIIR